MNDRKAVIRLKVILNSVGTTPQVGGFAPDHTKGLWLHRGMITNSGSSTTCTICDIQNYDGATATLLYAVRTATMNALNLPYDSASAGFDNNPYPIYIETTDPSYLFAKVETNDGTNSDTVTVDITVSAA